MGIRTCKRLFQRKEEKDRDGVAFKVPKRWRRLELVTLQLYARAPFNQKSLSYREELDTSTCKSTTPRKIVISL